MSETRQPLHPSALRLEVPSGLASYPPVAKWDDWVEYDTAHWPRKVEKRYQIIPTICFNCEAACGLLGFVDKETLRIRRFEGNPEHPGQPGTQLRQGAGDAQSGHRSRAHSLSLETGGKAGRRKMGTSELG